MHANLIACSGLTTDKLTNHRQKGLLEDTAEACSHHVDHAVVLQDAVMSLCYGPAALFTAGALVKAIAEFLTKLPQDSRAPPAGGLTWVTSCLLTSSFCTKMHEAQVLSTNVLPLSDPVVRLKEPVATCLQHSPRLACMKVLVCSTYM